MPNAARVALAAALLALTPGRAHAWGCDGHQIVALIAARHLSSAARARVDTLLASARLDPTLRRTCPAPELGRLADLSTWADDVRGERPETAAWHFIDIPRGVSPVDTRRLCAAGCVTRALTEELRVLETAGETPRRAEALMFVIHLIGDLHQPLHCTTNGDRGGNCVPVDFFGRRPHRRIDRSHPASHEDYEPNLHGVWDTDLPRRRVGATSLRTWARRLDERFADRSPAWERRKVDVAAWARETHAVAEGTAYGQLSRPIAVARRADVAHCSDGDHVARRMLALHERIDAAYEAVAGPVLEEQLARAGVRLAMVLRGVSP